MLQTKQNKKHPDCSNLILYSEINPFCTAQKEEFPGHSFDAPRGQKDVELTDFQVTWFSFKSNASDWRNNYKFSLSVIFGRILWCDLVLWNTIYTETTPNRFQVCLFCTPGFAQIRINLAKQFSCQGWLQNILFMNVIGNGASWFPKS